VSKTRYSAFKVLKEALTGHKGWEPTWRDAEPKADGYDVIIVGGGGHGLATAYYLAKNHGITNVAVLEKGWIGGGNVEETQPLFVLTICFQETSHFMNYHCSYGRILSKI